MKKSVLYVILFFDKNIVTAEWDVAMERNFWEKIKESFFDDNEEKINDRKAWENCIKNKESYKYALQLLAIAYFESRDKGDFEGSYGKYINSNYPEFEYRYFSQHRRDLLDQLRKFGVALLKHGNDCQYLRTILKYSGKMCVNIAKNISKNVHSWDEEQVKNQIKKYSENFEASFSGRDQAFEDAQNIFLTIAKQCRTNNQPPTLEELLDLQIDLTANIITQIHSILFNKEKSNFETRPTIKIDKGKAFFTLPEGKDAIFRKEIERALFEFKFSQNCITAFEYKKEQSI